MQPKDERKLEIVLQHFCQMLKIRIVCYGAWQFHIVLDCFELLGKNGYALRLPRWGCHNLICSLASCLRISNAFANHRVQLNQFPLWRFSFYFLLLLFGNFRAWNCRTCDKLGERGRQGRLGRGLVVRKESRARILCHNAKLNSLLRLLTTAANWMKLSRKLEPAIY